MCLYFSTTEEVTQHDEKILRDSELNYKIAFLHETFLNSFMRTLEALIKIDLTSHNCAQI